MCGKATGTGEEKEEDDDDMILYICMIYDDEFQLLLNKKINFYY